MADEIVKDKPSVLSENFATQNFNSKSLTKSSSFKMSGLSSQANSPLKLFLESAIYSSTIQWG